MMKPKSIYRRDLHHSSRHSALTAVIVLTLGCLPVLQAGIYFDNSAGTLDFGTAINWSTDQLPSVSGVSTSFIGGNQDVVYAGTMTTNSELQVGTDANPWVPARGPMPPTT